MVENSECQHGISPSPPLLIFDASAGAIQDKRKGGASSSVGDAWRHSAAMPLGESAEA
jgi:hypothetical protein